MDLVDVDAAALMLFVHRLPEALICGRFLNRNDARDAKYDMK